MTDARSPLAARDARLAGHCREGYRLALRDPAYRANVLARLHGDLGTPPDDLWTAIPWIWTAAIDEVPIKVGSMAGAVEIAAHMLREWLLGDEPLESLESRWQTSAAAPLGLGSTLRSHPFADLRAWSIRPPSAA